MYQITVGMLMVMAQRVGVAPSALLAALDSAPRVIEHAARVDSEFAHDVEEDGDGDIAMPV